jgi:3',5'-cyclic AMP phosphodiesterase CpdA
MIFAQITDTHIGAPGGGPLGGMDTARGLAECVASVIAMRPVAEAVVVTGDLVATGADAEYEHLRELLSPLAMPVYLIPGNHDAREPMRRVFAHHGYLPLEGRFLHYVIEDHALRLVALDTVVPGEPGGALCPERLEWLAARLREAPHRPTVILMHHPPIETGIVHMDGMNCAGAEPLGAIIARHPQVERILCGHVHRPIQVRWNGTIVSIGPSPAFQVALDLDPGAPACWIEEPPAYQVHLWRPGLGLVSHLAYVADFGPPRPFPHAE